VVAFGRRGSTRVYVEARAERTLSHMYRAGGSRDEYDQTDDGRARSRRGSGYPVRCASEEVQAHRAPGHVSDVRRLFNGRSVGTAKRWLWYIRNFGWNCHRSVDRHIQLAFGRRHERGPHLEQHHSRRSVGKSATSRDRCARTPAKPIRVGREPGLQ
jgi:hypothetical protein